LESFCFFSHAFIGIEVDIDGDRFEGALFFDELDEVANKVIPRVRRFVASNV
jgi:hypothetical protein